MASGQTSNYGLNQWAAEDPVLRTDFNQDNAKLDAALKTIPRLASGRYTGNGNASTTEEIRTLDCGFPPQMVIVFRDGGGATFSGLFVRPCAYGLSRFDSNGTVKVTWSETGVSWRSTNGYVDYSLNSSGATYLWWAIG